MNGGEIAQVASGADRALDLVPRDKSSAPLIRLEEIIVLLGRTRIQIQSMNNWGNTVIHTQLRPVILPVSFSSPSFRLLFFPLQRTSHDDVYQIYPSGAVYPSLNTQNTDCSYWAHKPLTEFHCLNTHDTNHHAFNTRILRAHDRVSSG